MRRILIAVLIVLTNLTFSQNVQVDSQTFTPQQLIEDILIDSDCIENVFVTNVVGGDFNNTDQSYGYFDASGTTFPFENGIILSTGRLQNAEGPNTSLSDDDAPNWLGDNDLETILNEPNTFNATIIEFDFTSVASQVSFRYIFASEEYQEGNPNTCQFSDLFGFLIRPINESQYTNIALVPNTQIPVKVTTVHPDIPNGCPAENETYFGGFNDATAPINYDGQTAILTATADVIPNETYHVKLVIADEQNYRYDSAVFLEAGSFQLSTDLGEDRLLATSNPLCNTETLELNAFQTNATSYKWFKDGIELFTEINSIYTVTSAGTYQVEVSLANNCVSFGEIVIEYGSNPIAFDSVLIECDLDQDGLTVYNLFDATDSITNSNSNLIVTGFFLLEAEALQNINAISEPTAFENTSINQTVFARIETQYRCFVIAELNLQISNNTLQIPPFTSCDDAIVDGFTIFNLDDLRTQIELIVPLNSSIQFYETLTDALADTNTLANLFENTTIDSQVIYVKITSNNQCYGISGVELRVLFTPLLEPDINLENPVYYCLNRFPETITLFAGVINDLPSNYQYLWNSGETASSIEINQPGTYEVLVTYSNGCSSLRSIEVVASNTATIEEIIVQDLVTNNTITINVSGEGVYEYSLDDINGPYQESNVFTNVSSGFHTVFVRDILGCGIVEEIVSVRGFPKFFTPNGDGYNDTWQVYGINHQFLSVNEIFIYNRYGKLLKQISPLGSGWNGRFNGELLPSTDYWFTIKFFDGSEYRGHFALAR